MFKVNGARFQKMPKNNLLSDENIERAKTMRNYGVHAKQHFLMPNPAFRVDILQSLKIVLKKGLRDSLPSVMCDHARLLHLLVIGQLSI